MKNQDFIFLVLLTICSLCSNSELTSTNFSLSRLKGACDKGFGFSGNCINSKEILKTVDDVPGDVGKTLDKLVVPLLKKIAAHNTEVCVGDFQGPSLASKKELTKMNCNTFPLDQSYKYGIVSAYVDNVPCGELQTLTVCAAFRRCGTFALSINGGVAQCIATVASGGFGAILSKLSKFVKNVNIGFSKVRDFTKKFKVATKVGNEIHVIEVHTRAHFYFGLGIEFPANFIKVKGESIKKFVKFSAELTFFVDFGGNNSKVDESVSNLTGTNGGDVNKVVEGGFELSIIVRGAMELKFGTLTKGFLSNINLELKEANILVTKGNGNSGLNGGFYLFLNAKVNSNLDGILSKITKPFKKFIEKIGVEIPSKVKIDGETELGIFINKDYLGFQFKFKKTTIMCMVRYNKFKASCKLNNKFITALLEEGDIVIKKVGAFFKKTGKEIGRITSKFKEKLKKVGNKIGKVIKIVKDILKKERKKRQERRLARRKNRQARRKTRRIKRQERRVKRQKERETRRKERRVKRQQRRHERQVRRNQRRSLREQKRSIKRLARKTARKARKVERKKKRALRQEARKVKREKRQVQREKRRQVRKEKRAKNRNVRKEKRQERREKRQEKREKRREKRKAKKKH